MTSSPPPASRSTRWLLGCAALAGLFLRLHLLRDQLLVDDEWHSLNYVIGRPLGEVVLRSALGANSVPENLWNAALLHGPGVTELAMRVPSVVSAAISLVALPALAWRLVGARAVALFAWLLAISPPLVFYARDTRPYGSVSLWGPFALLALLIAVRERSRRWLAAYAVAAVLAAWWHMYAAIPLGAATACVLAQAALDRARGGEPAGPPPGAVLAAALATGLGVLALAVAPLLVNPWWAGVMGKDAATLLTLTNLIKLVAGTDAPVLATAVALLAALGLARLAREAPREAMAVGAAIGAFALVAKTSHQEAIHAAILVLRYGITLWPVVLLLAALGLDAAVAALETRGGRLPGLLAAGAIGALFVSGPLLVTYRPPNDFTEHSAYQDSYASLNPRRVRERDLVRGTTMTAGDIPVGYISLSADPHVRGFVEYPMFIGDHFDMLPYYQRLNHLPVVIGFDPALAFAPLRSHDDFVYGDLPVDYVMNRLVAARPDTRFAHVVSLADLDRLRAEYAGWALVVHLDPMAEFHYVPAPGALHVVPLAATVARLAKTFGPPLILDGDVVAFAIR